MRRRFTAEHFFLFLVLATVTLLMAGQMWGTAFTCEDDMYTATAWQRLGGNAHGWPAVWSASWHISVFTGRFYQLFAYTLTQVPYRIGSFELVNAIRIGTMLFVFASFAAMLASVTRSLTLALYCSILCAGLIETRYNYNAFHAYPLWFSLGFGILFVAILLFQEGMVRGKHSLIYGASVAYFVSLLFYESILLYSIVFFALAYIHNRVLPGTRIAAAARALASVWPCGASAALYVLLYVGFSYRYPGSYTGKVLSFASFSQVTRTIGGFSLTGLNLRGILPVNRQWSAISILAALLIASAAFWAMRRLTRELAPRRLLTIGGLALICMFLPNILYGFSERYRHWPANFDSFYLGSFYSGFAEAVVIATISLLIVRGAARLRLAGALAVVVAVFFAIATYSNVSMTVAFYRVHRENRKIWDLVEASISATGGPSQAAVLVAPGLNQMKQLDPSVYNYWDYYFSEKLRRPLRVVGQLSEFRSLPQEMQAGPVFAFVCRYFPESQAGLFAFGPLDLDLWTHEGRMVAHDVRIGVLGGGSLSVYEETAGAPPGKMLHHAARLFVIEDQPVGLNGLVLRP
jgi:hypothetical protein